MDSSAENAQAALRVMRQWQWLRCDPDGTPFSPALGLSLVVNRLAMGGQTRPQSAVLTLLCQGNLISTGDYQWRKYQWGNHFYLEGTNANLDQKQWQNLANSIADEQRQFEEDEWPSRFIDLENLKLIKCQTYEWAFGDSRFTTALCPPDTEKYDPAYFEEWFSAWDIEVWPRFIRDGDAEVEPDPAVQGAGKAGLPVAASIAPANTKSGRPAEYDWLEATNAIWAKLYGNELKPKSQADIERALILHLKNGPGESTVRPFAKAIWEKFQEH